MRTVHVDTEHELREYMRPRVPCALANMTSDERKSTPLFEGCIAYFPDALAAVAQLSKFGNDKHNPGEPLHWAKDKSRDHKNCIARHLAGTETVDTESGFLHDVGLAWRALANLQTIIDKENGRPEWAGSTL